MMETIYFWQWLIVGLIFLILEIFNKKKIFIAPGMAAIVCALILVSSQPMSLVLQVVLFLFVSFFCYFFFYKAKLYFFESENKRINKKRKKWISGLIGQNHVLKKPIKNGRGTMVINGSEWVVQGCDMPTGTKVVITGIRGVVLIVEEYCKK